MKLPTARIEGFLRQPEPAVVAVLLYGPDSGLVAERGKALLTAILGAKPDPFRLSVLSAEDVLESPARLADEASSIGLMPGRRVVRIPDAQDRMEPALRLLEARATAEALVVLEAGDLPASSALRKLCEGSTPRLVALPCYQDFPKDRIRLIRAQLQEAGWGLSNDAAEVLQMALGGDRGLARRELEKLLMYLGPAPKAAAARSAPTVGLEAVRAVITEAGEADLDALLAAVAQGRIQAALGHLDRLLADGAEPIQALRVLGNHFLRLAQAQALVAEGLSAEAAMDRVRIFVLHRDSFAEQMRAWPAHRIEAAIDRVRRTESACKKTGAVPDLLLSDLVLSLARGAPRRR